MADERKTSWVPIPKVTGGAISGAVTTIVLWLLDAFAHFELPVPVTAAIGVLVTVGVAYVIPSEREW